MGSSVDASKGEDGAGRHMVEALPWMNDEGLDRCCESGARWSLGSCVDASKWK